jgi:hypothetical protein
LVDRVFACFVFRCYLCNVGFKGSSEFMLYVASCTNSPRVKIPLHLEK